MKIPASKIMASAARLIMPVLLLLLTCIAHEGSASAQGRAEGLEIKSIQVKLFKMREGTFGEDLVATDQARIVWNIGVNAISDTFLVVVEVTGPAEHRESLPTLVLTAETIRGVFQRQTARIFTAIDGKYYAAFLVPTTGCVPIKIVARIPRRRKPSIKSQLINFQCGE
ncbi:MAG TPA: hypothetical protein VM911_20865 [Pyrinomonadaceae bacterium]|jgi:hypothetical protein|nr:hypothetical protein [Pyrinomonadaceae bacterium]